MYNNNGCVLCSGDNHYADQWYHSCVQDGWHHPVTKECTNYTNVSVANKLNMSRQNCRVSERIVSAAEHLFMLASAQTLFSEQNGFVHCRSSSRDSGLGKDSDCGSGSSSIRVPCPGTQAPARGNQYVEDPRSPWRPSSQLSSQALKQPVCTVLPVRSCGRSTNHVAARQCDAPRYPASEAAQQEAFQHLNRCEVFNSRSPQMARQHRHQPELSDFSCKQHWGQRFPVAQNVAYYGNTVNPLQYGRSRMPSAHQLSHCRDDGSGQMVRYTTASMYGCSLGRGVQCVRPAGDVTDSAALVPEHHLTGTSNRMSAFDYSNGQDAYGQLSSAVRQNELLFQERHNVNASCHSAIDSHHVSADVARYRAMQQRYQPYDMPADIRRGNCTVPRGCSQNLFYQMSPRRLMQFRQNDELFYDSHTSGIR